MCGPNLRVVGHNVHFGRPHMHSDRSSKGVRNERLHPGTEGGRAIHTIAFPLANGGVPAAVPGCGKRKATVWKKVSERHCSTELSEIRTLWTSWCTLHLLDDIAETLATLYVCFADCVQHHRALPLSLESCVLTFVRAKISRQIQGLVIRGDLLGCNARSHSVSR